jgi:hypothetical protein
LGCLQGEQDARVSRCKEAKLIQEKCVVGYRQVLARFEKISEQDEIVLFY